MIMRAAVACVAALVISGCGVENEAVGPEAVGTAEQAIIWECSKYTDHWVRYWYTDTSRTYETGREYCTCGVYEKYGSNGAYYVGEVRSGACYPPFPPVE